MKKIIYLGLILLLGVSFIFLVSASFGFDQAADPGKDKTSIKKKVEENSKENGLSTSSVSFKTIETPDSQHNKGKRIERRQVGDGLSRSPEVVRSVYVTSRFASSEAEVNRLLDVLEVSSINSVVLDVNDFSGQVSYDSNVTKVNELDLESRRIEDLKGLIEKFHSRGIYVIARIPVFQDSALGRARPDLALKNSSSGKIFKDGGGQIWLDPASEEVWKYKADIAREVARLGADEINFDYIRFPSSENLELAEYPIWEKERLKSEVLKDFFKYLDDRLGEHKLSIDVFGVVLGQKGRGVGQALEDVFKYFDVVSPMIYPSHYSDGVFGFDKPAEHPYGTVAVALSEGVLSESYSRFDVKIRPWIQDFDLDVEYGKKEVEDQIRAVKEVMGEDYVGFMLWNPRNVYTWEALLTPKE